MHLLGFSISLAFLTLCCVFGVVSLVTNSWWLNEKGKFQAGLWQHCYQAECFQYNEGLDRSIKKLNVTKQTEGTTEDDLEYLNIVRGLVVFSLVIIGVGALFMGLSIYSIKSKSSYSIPVSLQVVFAVVIVVAGIIAFSSCLIATSYKKIFLADINNMKVGGSWILMFISSILAMIVGLVTAATLCYQEFRIKRLSSSKTKRDTDIVSNGNTDSQKSSRKGSNGVDLSLPQFMSLGGRVVEGMGGEGVDGVDGGADENENEYKIPETDEVIKSYQNLHEDNNTGTIADEQILSNNFTNLSEYSSQPIASNVLDSEFTPKKNLHRSASFSNQLYDDLN